MRLSIVIVALIGTVLVGCSVVSDKQARQEFEKAFPEAKLYEQFVGEGNDEFAYMHFRYTLSGSDARLEQVWLYQKQPDGSFRAIARDGPKPAGSDFGD